MSNEANEFAAARLFELRRRHRASAIIAPIVANGLQELQTARGLAGADTSVEVAALESFLADVLISVAQSSSELQQSTQLSSSAISRLKALATSATHRTKSLAVHSALLESIAHKASGDLDSAFVALERSERELSALLDTSPSDLVPLHRQRVLMLQREDAFAELASKAGAYRATHPEEYYATLKRVFEYLLNRRRIADASALFEPLRRAYQHAAAKLSPVAHVSFLKNAGHYLALTGYPRKGRAVLLEALRAAAQFNMHGQVRQINRLLADMPGGNPQLEAFQI